MHKHFILLVGVLTLQFAALTEVAPLCSAQVASDAEQASAKELDPETAAQLEEIGRQISATTMSPFCPGRTISACPSGQARALREQIFVWLKQGVTPEGVRNRLLITYGDEVRGTPKAEGVGLMAWIVPIVFIILLAALVSMVLFYLRSRSIVAKQMVGIEDSVIAPEMQDRIQNELESRRQS